MDPTAYSPAMTRAVRGQTAGVWVTQFLGFPLKQAGGRRTGPAWGRSPALHLRGGEGWNEAALPGLFSQGI